MLHPSEKVIVCFSGGLDSTTLLYLCKKLYPKVYAVSFDYGQRHKVELKYARMLAHDANVEHFIVKVPHYENLQGNSLTDINIEVPDEVYSDEIPITTVPLRNLVFLSIASSIADAYEIANVAIGIHSVDSPYPDCRPAFIEAMELAINRASVLYNKRGIRIKIFAPFIDKTKKEIAQLAYNLRVPVEMTYSCYKGTEPPCGTCATCKQRQEALQEYYRLKNKASRSL